MSTASRFHGVTVALVDTGARIIALPSTSIIGLCDTFVAGPDTSAKPSDLVLLNRTLEHLKLLDYQRVQEGYFRLVNEDEL